jgi:uncharacterized protein
LGSALVATPLGNKEIVMKNIILILLFSIAFVYQLIAKEVSINVNGCNIKGTLLVPISKKPVDVVLIVAGSGPTNRDGNNTTSIKSDTYKMLAELFFKEGIASLRYDKRGIGASDKVTEADMTIDDYMDDAISWIKFLQNDKRFSKITLLGHSEGSLIGMVASQKTKTSRFISVCGPGKPIDKIMDEQIARQEIPEYLLKRYRSILDSLKDGHEVRNVDKDLLSLFRPSIQQYMISWFKYDPCIEISKLNIPTLIIGGTTDIQVQTEDAVLLSKSNPYSKLVIITNMNHMLKEVATRETDINLKTYTDAALPLSPELCKQIIEFLKKE